jgi:diguanylate cyclase (GGDEF)-like protein
VFVQISVGVAAYPETADDPNLLLNRADVAMYYSKQHGRNRVTVDSEKVRKEVN